MGDRLTAAAPKLHGGQWWYVEATRGDLSSLLGPLPDEAFAQQLADQINAGADPEPDECSDGLWSDESHCHHWVNLEQPCCWCGHNDDDGSICMSRPAPLARIGGGA